MPRCGEVLDSGVTRVTYWTAVCREEIVGQRYTKYLTSISYLWFIILSSGDNDVGDIVMLMTICGCW